MALRCAARPHPHVLQDMAACKVAILQANPDPTVKLMEMADLYQKGMVSAEDLAGLKAKTLEALKA